MLKRSIFFLLLSTLATTASEKSSKNSTRPGCFHNPICFSKYCACPYLPEHVRAEMVECDADLYGVTSTCERCMCYGCKCLILCSIHSFHCIRQGTETIIQGLATNESKPQPPTIV